MEIKRPELWEYKNIILDQRQLFLKTIVKENLRLQIWEDKMKIVWWASQPRLEGFVYVCMYTKTSSTQNIKGLMVWKGEVFLFSP